MSRVRAVSTARQAPPASLRRQSRQVRPAAAARTTNSNRPRDDNSPAGFQLRKLNLHTWAMLLPELRLASNLAENTRFVAGTHPVDYTNKYRMKVGR